ncbi:TetR/AcrR family transcriptional regulator [Brevibacterium album]|uniref:TetR/AcrR family transcriptional regulator n=1 Tax=Brevibacterium album TaxID=417948 RepID=UPI000419E164|nr:TetR/AcrR family transcriptional regulator [Brevibacterium album]
MSRSSEDPVEGGTAKGAAQGRRSGRAKPGAGSAGTAKDDSADRKLEQAALQLLKQDGVLAGLNLREVADLAGINRGLVYHYFGSRGELLRSALRRNSERRSASYWQPGESLGFANRIDRLFRQTIRNAEQLRLVMLLLLDGRMKVRLMPRREQTQRDLEYDQAVGNVPADLDPIALHAMVQSMLMGYVVSRKSLASEFGMGVRDLDARMEALLERLVTVPGGEAHTGDGQDGPEAGGEDRAERPGRNRR